MPGGRIFRKLVWQLETGVVFTPLPNQPQLPGSQFEMAHGNAHVNALHVGLGEEAVEQPFPVARRAPQIKMPAFTLANDPPGLLV